jgi:hypothetical protein
MSVNYTAQESRRLSSLLHIIEKINEKYKFLIVNVNINKFFKGNEIIFCSIHYFNRERALYTLSVKKGTVVRVDPQEKKKKKETTKN